MFGSAGDNFKAIFFCGSVSYFIQTLLVLLGGQVFCFLIYLERVGSHSNPSPKDATEIYELRAVELAKAKKAANAGGDKWKGF